MSQVSLLPVSREQAIEWTLALSRGERVARDPDALHRDAGRVRGRLRLHAEFLRLVLPCIPNHGAEVVR
jgi:hypothetical protein